MPHKSVNPLENAASHFHPKDLSDRSFEESHFTPAEIAELWNVSTDSVRRLFRKEEGVLMIPSRNAHPGKRARYTTMRIPAGVVERVRRRYAICKN